MTTATRAVEGADLTQFMVEYVTVQEHQGVEGLVLCGRRTLPFGGQVPEEGTHVVLA